MSFGCFNQLKPARKQTRNFEFNTCCVAFAAVPASSVSTGAAQLVSIIWMGKTTLACSAAGMGFAPTLSLCVIVTSHFVNCAVAMGNGNVHLHYDPL